MKSFFSRFWSFIVFARFPLLVLAFFWLFTANVYAACSSSQSGFLISYSGTCINTDNNLSGYYSDCQTAYSGCPSTSPVPSSNLILTGLQSWSSNKCRGTNDGCGWHEEKVTAVYCTYTAWCESQTEADSLSCALNPDDPNCDDRCSVYHQQCEQLGGVFTGHQTPTGCAASCNTCGTTASKNILEIKIESCCNQGLAPSVERMCITPDIATGDGMQVSSNANLQCVDPNLGDDNLSLYVQYCEDDNPPGSSDSNQSSGSGDGSSSSGDGSSSSGDDNNSSGSGGAGEGYNYYPILDTIRDSLVDIRKNVKNIYTCLITPGTCTGLTPQVTVNVPSDSSFLKNINSTLNTTNTLLDSSLRDGNERIKNAIASANDTLIDSLRKFLNNSNDHTVDTLHNIHNSINDLAGNISGRLGYGDTATSTLRDELRGYFTGVEVDTGAVGFANSWISEGEAVGDSLGRAIGWIGGLDTVGADSVYGRAGWDSSGFDSINGFIGDTLGGILDSLHLQLKRENDSLKNSLSDSLSVWADSMIKVSPFAAFDSLIYSTIGARIPNSDNCPEDCQSWSLNLPRFGLINYTVDFGLCLGRVPLGGMNVLGFLKLLVRLVIVWTCISIVMWTFSHRKM